MKHIVKELLDAGRSVADIGKETGMKPEEVFRLAGLSREEFLRRMMAGTDGYSSAEFIVRRNTRKTKAG